MQALIADAALPDVAPGDHCFIPYECPYYAHCTRDRVRPDHGIGELSWLTAGHRAQLEDAGIEEIRDIPDEFPLTPLQHVVRRAVREQNAVIHGDISERLSGLALPVRYLDFETFVPAIPRFASTRPYDSVPVLGPHRAQRLGAL